MSGEHRQVSVGRWDHRESAFGTDVCVKIGPLIRSTFGPLLTGGVSSQNKSTVLSENKLIRVHPFFSDHTIVRLSRG